MSDAAHKITPTDLAAAASVLRTYAAGRRATAGVYRASRNPAIHVVARDADEDAAALSRVADWLETMGWRDIASAPTGNERVWVIGGRRGNVPELVPADGMWWRMEAERGSPSPPTHWCPAIVPRRASPDGG